MTKSAIGDFSATASDNTDVAGINIGEGCAPGNINDAIRALMAIMKGGIAPLQLITAAGDTLMGTGAGVLVKKTLLEAAAAFADSSLSRYAVGTTARTANDTNVFYISGLAFAPKLILAVANLPNLWTHSIGVAINGSKWALSSRYYDAASYPFNLGGDKLIDVNTSGGVYWSANVTEWRSDGAAITPFRVASTNYDAISVGWLAIR